MTWFIYSLLGAVLMSAYSLSIRLLLKDKGDAGTFTFITTFFGGLAIIFLLPFEKIRYFFNIPILIAFIALPFLYALTDLLFIRGRQLEEVSIVSILIQLGNFWSLMGGTLIFKESLTTNKIIGVGLIIIGSILLIWHKQKIRLSKGKYLIILATILFTANAFASKEMVNYFSTSLYIFIAFLLEALVLFVFFLPGKYQAIKKEFKVQGKTIILVGPLLSLAVFCLLRAFQVGGEASRVLPVYSLSLVFSVLAGTILLGEKGNFIKKLIAMSLAFAGTYFLQVF